MKKQTKTQRFQELNKLTDEWTDKGYEFIKDNKEEFESMMDELQNLHDELIAEGFDPFAE